MTVRPPTTGPLEDRQRRAGARPPDLTSFFAPRHVVVIGASSDPARVGGRPIAYLQRLGFEGQISPVNPKRDEIAGLRCYPSVLAVPDEPDLALIAVAGAAAVRAVEECGQRGVGAAIVFTAGFGEVGAEGRELERELLAAAERYGVRLCGPNTLGIISSPQHVPATFGTCLDRTETLEPGNVGLVSQSGALGAFMHRECQLLDVPLRHFVATGNEVDLTAGDYLHAIVGDPEVRAVGMYLEGIRDGDALIAGLERARELGKPVCILKVGRSERARAAAQSHTGALAGEDDVVDAILRQYGALRVDSIDDLLAFLQLASALTTWPASGGLGVVSLSGGLGVWAADVAERAGVRLPDLEEGTRTKLGDLLPSFASSANPVDVTGQIVNDPDLIAESLLLVAADENVDLILVGLGIQEHLGPQIARGIVRAAAETSKPIVTAWMAGPDEAYSLLTEGGLPWFSSLGTGLSATTHLAAWASRRRAWLERTDGPARPAAPQLDGADLVGTELEAKQVLRAAGVDVPAGRLVGSADDVRAYVEEVGGAVVLKGQVAGVAHKTELGLVEVGLATATEAADAFERMQRSARNAGLLGTDGVLTGLVEEMVDDVVELILGYRYDPVFGPVILLGLGGTRTELLRSFANRHAPLEVSDVEQMLRESDVARVLGGFRGGEVVDVAPLCETVLRFADLVTTNQDRFAEIEINPLGVRRGDGRVVALDALFVPHGDDRTSDQRTRSE